MARGKAAAQSANRRLAEAQERITELEKLLREERAGRVVEVREAREERDRAQNRLISEVDKLAGEAVRRAEMRVEEVRAEEREAARRRVIAGWRIISEYSRSLTGRAVAEMADAFGVQMSELVPGMKEPGLLSRDVRRLRNSTLTGRASGRQHELVETAIPGSLLSGLRHQAEHGPFAPDPSQP